jgi:hypothetical protein
MRPELLAAVGGSLLSMANLSSRENSPAAQTSALEFLNLAIPLRLRHMGEVFHASRLTPQPRL